MDNTKIQFYCVNILSLYPKVATTNRDIQDVYHDSLPDQIVSKVLLLS